MFSYMVGLSIINILSDFTPDKELLSTKPAVDRFVDVILSLFVLLIT